MQPITKQPQTRVPDDLSSSTLTPASLHWAAPPLSDKSGEPRPIAVYPRSFTETEAAWSTFEKELYAIREALAATAHFTKGFQVVVYTGHKNNFVTSLLLSNRRINKKLLRWSLDLEELGSKISRIWLKGVDNVLGDAPARNPHNRDMLYKLPIPAGLVKRIITAMSAKPIELDQEL